MSYNISTINPSFHSPYFMAADPFKTFKDKVNQLDDKAMGESNLESGKIALSMLGVLPMLRRDVSVIDKVEEGNLAGAGLQIAIGLANLPGDWREVAAAGEELFTGVNPIKNPSSMAKIAPNLYKAATNPENIYQRPLSSVSGTFLNGLTVKHEWLNKLDKTLFDTKFGELVKKSLNIKTEKAVYKVVNGKEIIHFKFAGKGIQKIVGKALLRTPVIGIGLGCLMEMPAIIKSAKQGDTIEEKSKSVFKQVCKSAGYVGLMTAGIGLAGAAFGKFGTTISLVGMALGSSGALSASRQLNKAMDKIMA